MSLNLPKIHGFLFILHLVSFSPSSQSFLPMSSLDSNLILPHLAQGNNSCQRGQSPLETPTQVVLCCVESDCVFKWSHVSNTIWLDSIPFFCVLWLYQHFFSPLQILRRKMRRHESPGSVPSWFLLQFGGNKWDTLQPYRSCLYFCALVLQVSLGPVVPKSHARTDYTPARHCSVPHSGFALSGRALIIIVQETSNTSPTAFDAV